MPYLILWVAIVPAERAMEQRRRMDVQYRRKLPAQNWQQLLIVQEQHVSCGRSAEKYAQQHIVRWRAQVPFRGGPRHPVDVSLLAGGDDDSKAVKRVRHIAAAIAQVHGADAGVPDAADQTRRRRRDLRQDGGGSGGRG